MGQTQYSPPPSSGGGGTNYWKIGAGGILQPDLVTYPSIAAVSMAFGVFEFYIDDTNIFAKADDGAGNSAVLQIPDVYDVVITVQDASGNGYNSDFSNNFMAIQIYDAAGDFAEINIDVSDILIRVTSSTGEVEQIALSPGDIFIEVANGKPHSRIELQVNSLIAEVIDAGGNMAGMLVDIAQQSFGYRDSGGVAESLLVAFPTSALMYVRDAGGNIGEAMQSVGNFGIQFNGASTFENNVDGFIYYDEFDPGAGAYVGYSGIMQIKDIGGTIYSIPYL